MRFIVIPNLSEMTTVGSVGFGSQTVLGAIPDSRRPKKLAPQELPMPKRKRKRRATK